MYVFMIVAGVGLALVVGAWLKLAPTAEDRRRAALRQAAIDAGLRVRWMPASELAGLGLTAGHVWYGLPLPDAGRASCNAVRRDGAWVVEGEGLQAVAAAPAGVAAVRVVPSEVAVAWDERQGEPLADIVRLLNELSAVPGG